ncbi:class D sortase [Shimazuella sp. AN120528]|uniref:class D sortase n=1 Tax=Shimazuella soli TaxID=1892854 RepID=UPI001F0EA0B0|nr:class D sortase [Shimazuella soli]MCH5585679.1 class D sortase [Shimazuella soli]
MKWDRIIALFIVTAGVAYGSYSLILYFQKLQNNETVISTAEVVKQEENAKLPIGRKLPIIVPKDQRPKTGQHFADLIIPRLKVKIPVIEGTDEDELSVGAGHYAGSVLPGEGDNCVIAGHRDTVFRRMGKLKKGDLLQVSSNQGVFTYRIRKMWITNPDDRTVIVPRGEPILTLATCYPFIFIGPAPKRYIIEATLVK